MTGGGTVELAGVTLTTDGATRLRDVDAQVLPGRLVAIVGANGSGKSSLLDVLAGVVAPTTGRVLIDGTPIGSLSPGDLARRRAWLGQSTLGASDYCVQEVIGWGGSRVGGGSHGARSVEETASAFELLDLLDVPLGRLSGGERQRTHLARIWMQDVPITLLDEPDANLDDVNSLRLRRLIDDKRESGRTVVVVTHDRSWAQTAADEIWVMEHGSLRRQ